VIERARSCLGGQLYQPELNRLIAADASGKEHLEGCCATGKPPHPEISRKRSTSQPIIAIHNMRSAHVQTNETAHGNIATGQRGGWLGNDKSHMEGDSNSLNAPSLFEFQSDTGEYDLRIIPKCPTSGVWAELYVGTSLHVCLLLESRIAGSGARRVVSSTSQDEHRQILPCYQVMFKPGKHPCSYPRHLHQSTGADDPPRSGLQSGHH
jgi:hypothetical protein